MIPNPNGRHKLMPDKDKITPLHSLGQNFLKDRSIARRIVDTIPQKPVTIIEIGPGLGILTDLMVERGYDLRAYELDQRCFRILKERYKGNDKVIIENRDIMDVLCKEDLALGHYIVSNLPFNISSAIISRILDLTHYPFQEDYRFCGATLMFQKEFADRLMADHGTKAYGRLSITFKSKLEAHRVLEVNRSCFHPEPKVDASVLVLGRRMEPLRVINDTALFERILKTAFAGRRRQLKNSLNSGSMGLRLDKMKVEKVLADMGMDRKRPEEIPADDFICLANRLSTTSNG
jgi:16S rRNA (adenine1518-N6/adenine1519-N6)-dimethyltransferase